MAFEATLMRLSDRRTPLIAINREERPRRQSAYIGK
jgi:hypothetical protein